MTWSVRRASRSWPRTRRSSTTRRMARDVITINIIDTPGHADFGGERRARSVDGRRGGPARDRLRGPLPQTASCSARRSSSSLPLILCSQQDGPPGLADRRGQSTRRTTSSPRPGRGRGADRVPDRLRVRRDGIASLTKPARRHVPGDSTNLEPFFSTILEHVPAPTYDERPPSGARHEPGRRQLPRPHRAARVEQGELRKGQTVAWIKRDGTIQNVRITELMMTEALTRKPAEVAGGDICAACRHPGHHDRRDPGRHGELRSRCRSSRWTSRPSP